MKHRTLAWLFALMIPAVAMANEGATQKVIDAGRASSEVMNHLDVLCNQIGARLTASYGEERACDWALETFKSYGLDARIEIAGEVPVGFERGPWSGNCWPLASSSSSTPSSPPSTSASHSRQ